MELYKNRFFLAWAIWVERVIFGLAALMKADVFVDRFFAWWSKLLRWNAGATVGPGVEASRKPTLPLELFEYTGCTECSKVRECISYLGLSVIFFPCPPEGSADASGNCQSRRFRDNVQNIGGKEEVPFLVDPNTEASVYESEKIISYLFEYYGADVQKPWFAKHCTSKFNEVLLFLSAASRPLPWMSFRATASGVPSQPLELYGNEGCPECRIVQESLCTLELQHRLYVVNGSGYGIETFEQRFGKDGTIPALYDPLTNSSVCGGQKARNYLRSTYRTDTPPTETAMDYGNTLNAKGCWENCKKQLTSWKKQVLPTGSKQA